MSKQNNFSQFLDKLKEYESIQTLWFAKLIENGRQALQFVFNNINNEQQINLIDSFMNFISLLAKCHSSSLSDKKKSLVPSEPIFKNQNESQELLSRNDIIKMMNNDLQCPICNEWLFKATSANCSHTFCKPCIQKWLKINKTCPVCRTSIQHTSTSIAVDNFITNLCQMFGGFIKKQRESIQNAQIDHTINQTNFDLTFDEQISELSISQTIEDDTFISQLETTMPMTHPNMVLLMPSPQSSHIPLSRANTNICHPNTVQLSHLPPSSVSSPRANHFQPTSIMPMVSPRSNHLQPISSIARGSARLNRPQLTSASVASSSVNRFRNIAVIGSSTRHNSNIANLLPCHQITSNRTKHIRDC